MKILHIITTIELGGAEKQLLTLCDEQTQLEHMVKVIFLKGLPSLAPDFADIGVETIDLSSETFLNQIIRIKHISREFAPNVIHGHLPRAELLCLFSNPKNGYCVTRHNAEKFWPGTPNIVSKTLSNLVIRNSKACVVISEAVRDFGKKSGEIPNSDKVKLVPYGIKSSRSPTRVESAGKVWNLLCISRLEFQKDLPTLLHSIQLIKARGFKVHLDILGEGSLEEDLKSLCNHLEIAPNVTFHGKIKDVELFYRRADLLVLPSLYEGFGLVYLESLMHGLPVVTSRNSAALEIFGQEYDGLFDIGNYHELSNVIVKMSDKIFTTKRARLYEHILQKYDSKQMAKALGEVYEFAF